MKRLFYILIVLVTSCAPKVEELAPKDISLPQGPKSSDMMLNEDSEDSFANAEFANANEVKKTDSKSVLHQIEAQFEISKLTGSEAWAEKAFLQFKDLEKVLTTKKTKADQFVYMDLVYNQIKDDVEISVDDVEIKITEDSDRIIEMIRSKKKGLSKIVPETSLHDQLKIAGEFLKTITAQVKEMELMPEFKKVFLVQLENESRHLLDEAKKLDEALVASSNLSDGIAAITKFLQETGIEISEEDKQSVARGQKLAEVLATLDSPKTALQAIAIVWSMLSHEKRIEYFQATNAELYKFLSEKSDEDIKCLSDRNCEGLITRLVLNIGVYPAIEKHGVAQVKETINTSGKAFLITKIGIVASESVPKIGETITSKILSSVGQKKKELTGFKNNLREHLTNGFNAFLKAKKIDSINEFIVDKNNANLDLETQAVFLRTKLRQLPYLKDSSDILKSQFELIEDALLLPLFSKRPEQLDKAIRADLDKILVSPTARQYLNSTSSNESEIRLNQQSEVLATMSYYINELVDWKKSTFDNHLSSVQAKEILTKFKTEALNRPFFAKTDLLPLVLSISSQTLKLMEGEDSPLVLINHLGELISVQKFKEKTAGPVAMAAATDFKDGTRVQVVKANDLARFHIAIMKFYQAIEMIDQTKSELLLKAPEGRDSLLNQLIMARKNLRRLIVAIGNYTSNQMMQPNGLLISERSIYEGPVLESGYHLLDQTMAIEALVQAYEITKIDVYLWSAMDIYYSLNKNMFSKNSKFYQNTLDATAEIKVDYNTALLAYKNILNLKPYLKAESQTQFENIFAAWIH